MGFFDRFKSTEDNLEDKNTGVPWQQLQSIDQLDIIVKESQTKPVAIFKHSTRCGVSRGVLKSFERSYDLPNDGLKLYFLDLLANRDISNEIATRFKVHHESPQMIVLKNGEVVYHDSHYSIDPSVLKKYI